ncbi:MAG: sulfatase family protein [Acidobacteriaceae bacterium]
MAYSRREFLEAASVAAASSLIPGSSALGETGATNSKQRRPNIILMLGDDHRWNALGCMGDKVIQTPNLDKLGHDGVIFENNFTTMPICCASRASIMMGQYASTTAIYNFSKPLSTEQVDGAYWTRLKNAGYRVGFVGKFGVGKTMPSKSFDYWRGFPGQGNYYPEGPKGRHMSQIIRGQAEEFIREGASTQPFCLSISFKSPHVEDQSPRQYLPEPKMLELYKNVTIPAVSRAPQNDINRMPLRVQHSESRHRWGVRFSTEELYQESVKGYYGLISGIDSVVGNLRRTLEEQGIADNTIIIYSADHGIFNGEHGLAGKWYLYEEALRTPLLVYDPRQPAGERGMRRRAMTLNIDLHPTMLELAGVEPAPSVEGRSFVDLLHKEDPEFRSVFFIEHHFPYGGWIPSSEGIRTERWKYIYWTGHKEPRYPYAAPYETTSSAREELYDLENDPYEMHNLIGRPETSNVQRALSEYRKRWNLSVHDMRGKSTRWTEPIDRSTLKQDGVIT